MLHWRIGLDVYQNDQVSATCGDSLCRRWRRLQDLAKVALRGLHPGRTQHVTLRPFMLLAIVCKLGLSSLQRLGRGRVLGYRGACKLSIPELSRLRAL